jgi:ketosteroid isomerase-like protein
VRLKDDAVVRATENGATVIAVVAAFAIVAVVWLSETLAQEGGAAVKRTVEIRSYNLMPGTRGRFHQLVESDALPLLRRARIDVVSYGPSLHDADSYYLIRSFASIDDRQRTEDAFYGSAEWRDGPREAILACIENYTTVVVELDAATLDGLRNTRLQPRPARQEDSMTQTAVKSDYATLLDLNADYIRAVQTSDVARFREILAEDFLCSLPDGSLIDKARFLEHTAVPASISNLEAHDIQVRLMGEVAIVHARTTFNLADGRPWSGRYTDVWARRQGQWVAVSAHVTRR